MILYNLLLSAGATVLVYGLWILLKALYNQWTSPLNDLPGPPNPSWIFGNIKQIFDAENSVLHEQWVRNYGPTIKYKGFFNTNRLYTTDTKALNYILSHSDAYQKPSQAKYNLSKVLGPGLLIVEGDKHRQQRRIMNPAFGPVQVRALTGIFIEKSLQLRDAWSAEISSNKQTNEPSTTGARVEVLSWLSRATLDIIGMAGFNYRFDALNTDGKPNELNDAFAIMFRTQKFTMFQFLQALFPIFRLITTDRDRKTAEARRTMTRIGSQLLTSSKSLLTSQKLSSPIERNDIIGRDLLSLLVKANMATDLKEGQSMADEDVLAQIATFIVAGHETTSSATTWALYALCLSQSTQTTLRTELLAVPTDHPTMDELNALPYLDMVVREVLRLHAPVPSTIRVAMKDDVLPLNTPFIDKKGVAQDGISVHAGDPIFIPILAMNRSTELWGKDAGEFIPERWENIPKGATSIPGVWGNMLTFLGGPRACIGYRFSLVEMKALLFTLVRAFEFKLAVPANEIGKKQTIVQRPIVVSEPEAGNQMPLLIRPYRG